MPVDRYYIAKFLSQHSRHIRGKVLEVKSSTYTAQYGTGVESAEVLDIDGANPAATIVADLAAADHVASSSFDSFILTQTLQLIYDVHGAVRHSHRILRQGGHLLVTVPTLSRIVPGVDCWRFTPQGCEALFGGIFGASNVEVFTYGNLLASISFLSGMAAEELRTHDLDFTDENIPLLVAVHAVK